MQLIHFVFIYILLCIYEMLDSTTLTKSYRKEKDLVLKPIELVDLISIEENRSPETALKNKYYATNNELASSQFRKEVTNALDINRDVEAGVVTRKVWSRWSKWGQCSTSCGGGTKVRRRMCLAGRCAPGEREEQHRPCHSKPCELR